MSWWWLLRRLTPAVRLPPRPRPEEPLPPEDRPALQRALNTVLADHWHNNLEQRVHEIEAEVGNLQVELALHQLGHTGEPIADGPERG